MKTRQTPEGSGVEANGVDMAEVILGLTRQEWLDRINGLVPGTEQEMLKIKLARAKLLDANGQFGVCEDNRGDDPHEITPKRMKELPTVTRCFKCQQRADRRQRAPNRLQTHLVVGW